MHKSKSYEIKIIEEKLTDGSLIYNIDLCNDEENTKHTFTCIDQKSAISFLQELTFLINLHTCDVAIVN